MKGGGVREWVLLNRQPKKIFIFFDPYFRISCPPPNGIL